MQYKAAQQRQLLNHAHSIPFHILGLPRPGKAGKECGVLCPLSTLVIVVLIVHAPQCHSRDQHDAVVRYTGHHGGGPDELREVIEKRECIRLNCEQVKRGKGYGTSEDDANTNGFVYLCMNISVPVKSTTSHNHSHCRWHWLC